MVKDTQYLLLFNVNVQPMIKVQTMHKSKERAHPVFAAVSCEGDLARQMVFTFLG